MPYLHLTVTMDDLPWRFFRADRSLLTGVLAVAAQAVNEILAELYPGVRGRMI